MTHFCCRHTSPQRTLKCEIVVGFETRGCCYAQSCLSSRKVIWGLSRVQCATLMLLSVGPGSFFFLGNVHQFIKHISQPCKQALECVNGYALMYWNKTETMRPPWRTVISEDKLAVAYARSEQESRNDHNASRSKHTCMFCHGLVLLVALINIEKRVACIHILT